MNVNSNHPGSLTSSQSSSNEEIGSPPPSSSRISTELTQQNILENNNNHPSSPLSGKGVEVLTGEPFPQNIEPLSQQIILGKSSIKQEGGHAGAFRDNNNGTITKTTSSDEATMYTKIRNEEDATFASLRSITPAIHEVNGKEVTMEKLTHPFNNPTVLDIKLGKKTFSKTVNEFRTGQSQKFKKLKQKLVDWIVARDFRVIKGNGAKERYQAAKNSETTIRQDISESGIDLGLLRNKLDEIQQRLDAAPVAFYGHSLLFVMGENKETGEPDLTIKLIDIGHYLTADEAENNPSLKRTYDELRANTNVAIEQLKDFIAELAERES